MTGASATGNAWPVIFPGAGKRTVESRVAVVPFYDRSGLIREPLGTLEEALSLQILVTVLVVVVMIFHLRSSLLISLTLPLAVLLCFIAMRIFDVTANVVALAGIATDDGVVMATYLDQSFAAKRPEDRDGARRATIAAATRRVRPCLMTTATTLLALLPVLTSTGRGANIMIPMAIPVFGGMLIEVMTMLVAPVLYCWRMERRSRSGDAARAHS